MLLPLKFVWPLDIITSQWNVAELDYVHQSRLQNRLTIFIVSSTAPASSQYPPIEDLQSLESKLN